MPTAQIQALAKDYNKNVAEVEAAWDDIKAGLLRTIPETDDKFYPILVSTLKRRLSNKKAKTQDEGLSFEGFIKKYTIGEGCGKDHKKRKKDVSGDVGEASDTK